jgi:hypothetical protein
MSQQLCRSCFGGTNLFLQAELRERVDDLDGFQADSNACRRGVHVCSSHLSQNTRRMGHARLW